MKITQQVHVMENDLKFTAGRLWDTIEEAPAWGSNTVVVKIGVTELGWDMTLFIEGDDANLFLLQTQLRDLADQVEELISPDAMIVEYVNVGEQDGEGM